MIKIGIGCEKYSQQANSFLPVSTKPSTHHTSHITHTHTHTHTHTPFLSRWSSCATSLTCSGDLLLSDPPDVANGSRHRCLWWVEPIGFWLEVKVLPEVLLSLSLTSLSLMHSPNGFLYSIFQEMDGTNIHNLTSIFFPLALALEFSSLLIAHGMMTYLGWMFL